MRRPKVVLKPLDPAHPANPDHPRHKRKWLQVAAALGRLMADVDYDRLQKGKQHEDGRTLRKVLK